MKTPTLLSMGALLALSGFVGAAPIDNGLLAGSGSMLFSSSFFFPSSPSIFTFPLPSLGEIADSEPPLVDGSGHHVATRVYGPGVEGEYRSVFLGLSSC